MTQNSSLTAVAWDSFLKLEESDKNIKKISVPSLPLCGIVFTSTFFSYNYFFPSISVVISGILFLLLTLLSLFICTTRYLNYFKSANGFNYSRISVIIFTSITLPAIIFIQIYYTYGLSPHPSSITNISAVVKNIENKKTFTEITAEGFINPEHSPEKIILYYNGKLLINKNDEIFIHKTIQYKKNSNVYTSYNSHKLRGINYTSSISDDDITIISKAEPGTREILKYNLNNCIDNLYNKDTAGMIKALFTGNRNSVSKEATIKFRNAGVLHLLAASGLHVGIAAALPLFLLMFNFRKKNVLFFSLLSVLSYLYLTDMPISLVRASLMFFLFAVQVFLHRRPSAFNTLMLSGSIIVLSAPWEIFNIGFQLSFGATLGIILFYEPYRRSLKHFHSYLRKSMAITLAAQVFTVPMIAFHLNQINTISILSNLILIPLTTVFMYLSFASLVLSELFHSTHLIFSIIPEYAYLALVKSAGFFADFNFNYFIKDNIIPVMILMSLSLIPVIHLKATLRIKALPVFASIILCTIYLEGPAEKNADETVLSAGLSSITVKKKCLPELTLDIHNLNDIDILFNQFKSTTTDIKVIILKNSSYPNLIACKRICNDFIIDECSFSVLPEITVTLKNLICTLETDKTKIIFPAD